MPKKKTVKKETAVNIPAAIKKQADKADDLQQSLIDGNDTGAQQDPVPDKGPDPTKIAPTNPDPAQEPVVAATPDPYVPPAISDPSAPTDEYKNKYDVLKGKYDVEVPRLSTEIESLKLVINQMQAAMDSMPAQVSPTRVDSGIKPLNPEDFEGYGDDIVKMAQMMNAVIVENERLTAAMGQHQPAAATGETTQRIERLETTVQKTNEDKYYETLTLITSDWRQINTSKAFDQWLNVVDPITMVPRRDIIQYAAQQMNAQQVGHIFNQFKKDSGMIVEAPASSPGPTVENDHLAGQVMPVANAGPVNDLEQTGPHVVYPTTTEFKQASKDFVIKRITEEQYKDISDRYQLAIKANKVMP